jgi:hypothetical protein
VWRCYQWRCAKGAICLNFSLGAQSEVHIAAYLQAFRDVSTLEVSRPCVTVPGAKGAGGKQCSTVFGGPL